MRIDKTEKVEQWLNDLSAELFTGSHRLFSQYFIIFHARIIQKAQLPISIMMQP
jgi:hypothetical protein